MIGLRLGSSYAIDIVLSFEYQKAEFLPELTPMLQKTKSRNKNGIGF